MGVVDGEHEDDIQLIPYTNIFLITNDRKNKQKVVLMNRSEETGIE